MELNIIRKHEKMGQESIGYFLAHLLGIGSIVSGILLNLNSTDSWKSGMLFVLGLVYLFLRIVNAYQDARKKKIENDERSYELKLKHFNDKKNKNP